MKLLSFGEVLWDVYPDSRFIGGAPLNFAAHFAKHGGQAFMVSAVGNDDLGADTLRQIQKFNVKTNYITVSKDKETGKCLVSLDKSGIPSYSLLNDVAYDYIDGDSARDKDFDALYFGTLALRGEKNRQSILKIIDSNNIGEVFVDVNIRPPFFDKDSIELCLKNATILKISDEELPTILENVFGGGCDYTAAAAKIGKRYKNIKLIIITRGAQGAYAFDCAEKTGYSCDAVSTDVVSTVGAGDSFSAAFIYMYLRGEDIQKSLAHAAKISAYVVSQKGAIPDYTPF